MRERRPLLLPPRALHGRGLVRRGAPPPAGHGQPGPGGVAHGARCRSRPRRPGQHPLRGVGHGPARSRRRRRVHGQVRDPGAGHLRRHRVRGQRRRLEPRRPPGLLGRQAGQRGPRPRRLRAARRRPAVGRAGTARRGGPAGGQGRPARQRRLGAHDRPGPARRRRLPLHSRPGRPGHHPWRLQGPPRRHQGGAREAPVGARGRGGEPRRPSSRCGAGGGGGAASRCPARLRRRPAGLRLDRCWPATSCRRRSTWWTTCPAPSRARSTFFPFTRSSTPSRSVADAGPLELRGRSAAADDARGAAAASGHRVGGRPRAGGRGARADDRGPRARRGRAQPGRPDRFGAPGRPRRGDGRAGLRRPCLLHRQPQPVLPRVRRSSSRARRGRTAR